MNEPKLRVLGVYKPLIPAETRQEQSQSLGGEAGAQEHFDGLVLLELIAENITDPLKLGEIGQTHIEAGGTELMQVAYDEGLLSLDGETLILRGFDWDSEAERGTFRFAFYLHLYDPTQPLETPFGPVACPVVQEAPERLMMLMPYTPCD